MTRRIWTLALLALISSGCAVAPARGPDAGPIRVPASTHPDRLELFSDGNRDADVIAVGVLIALVGTAGFIGTSIEMEGGPGRFPAVPGAPVPAGRVGGAGNRRTGGRCGGIGRRLTAFCRNRLQVYLSRAYLFVDVRQPQGRIYPCRRQWSSATNRGRPDHDELELDP